MTKQQTLYFSIKRFWVGPKEQKHKVYRGFINNEAGNVIKIIEDTNENFVMTSICKYAEQQKAFDLIETD